MFPTRQQLAVVQRASQGSYTGAVVRDVPLLQRIRNLTVGLDPGKKMKHSLADTYFGTTHL